MSLIINKAMPTSGSFTACVEHAGGIDTTNYKWVGGCLEWEQVFESGCSIWNPLDPDNVDLSKWFDEGTIFLTIGGVN